MKKLSLGDPAPPLTVHSCLKGRPFTGFQPGKVYLIEFNNTGCIPCAQTITQLHPIATKFLGEVEVISIYNHEYLAQFEKHYENVKNRIRLLGNQLNFTVAIDVPERTTEANWGGEKTHYYVVNQSGRIAFTGNSHNGNEIDNALTAILDGKNDLNDMLAEQEEITKKLANLQLNRGYFYLTSRHIRDANAPVPQGWKDSLKAAIKYVDESIARYPFQTKLYQEKADLLIYEGDVAKLNKYLNDMLSVGRKIKHFNWAWTVGIISSLQHNYPYLFDKMDRDIMLTIVERAITGHPLLTSLSSLKVLKMNLYLLSARYEDAMNAFADAAAKSSLGKSNPPLRNAAYHELVIRYLITEKKSGKAAADTWLKKSLIGQKQDAIVIKDLTLEHLGYSELSTKLIDALARTADNKKVKEEMAAAKILIAKKLGDSVWPSFKGDSTVLDEYIHAVTALKAKVDQAKDSLRWAENDSSIMTVAERQALEKRMMVMADDLTQYQFRYAASHPSSIYSLKVLQEYRPFLVWYFQDKPDSLMRIYNNLGSEIRAQDTGRFAVGPLITGFVENSPGKAFRPFITTDQHNNRIDLSQFKGKVILLDFWGSWCKPCRASHPLLKELYARYRSRGLVIVAVAQEMGTKDSRINNWKKATQEDGITWISSLNDPDTVDLVKEYGVSAFPTKILVDRNGVICWRSLGADGLEAAIKKALR